MKAGARVIWLALLAGCATSELPPPVDPRCDRVVTLAEAGELKPAVDEMATLEAEGVSCPEAVQAGVEQARARLAEADAYVHQALERKRGGDSAAARESFRRALAVYPKYYWVEKLYQDLDEAVQADVSSLREQADRLRSHGDLRGALEALEMASALAGSDPQVEAELQSLRRHIAERSLARAREAEQQGDLAEAELRTRESMAAQPADPDLKTDIVEYARLLGLKLFAAGELTRAEDLWSRALSLDDANEKLREYLREVEVRLRNLDKIKTEDSGSGRD